MYLLLVHLLISFQISLKKLLISCAATFAPLQRLKRCKYESEMSILQPHSVPNAFSKFPNNSVCASLPIHMEPIRGQTFRKFSDSWMIKNTKPWLIFNSFAILLILTRRSSRIIRLTALIFTLVFEKLKAYLKHTYRSSSQRESGHF